MLKFLKLIDETYESSELENPDYEGMTPAQEYAVKNFIHNGHCKNVSKEKSGKVKLNFDYVGERGNIEIDQDGQMQLSRVPNAPENVKDEDDEDDEADSTNVPSSPVSPTGTTNVSGQSQTGLTSNDVDLITKLSGGKNQVAAGLKDKVNSIVQQYSKTLDNLKKKADQQVQQTQQGAQV